MTIYVSETGRTRLFFNYLVDFIYNYSETREKLCVIQEEVRCLCLISYIMVQ